MGFICERAVFRVIFSQIDQNITTNLLTKVHDGNWGATYSGYTAVGNMFVNIKDMFGSVKGSILRNAMGVLQEALNCNVDELVPYMKKENNDFEDNNES